MHQIEPEIYYDRDFEMRLNDFNLHNRNQQCLEILQKEVQWVCAL
jgi:hypothetical protein